jgi:hypothetical protein
MRSCHHAQRRLALAPPATVAALLAGAPRAVPPRSPPGRRQLRPTVLAASRHSTRPALGCDRRTVASARAHHPLARCSAFTVNRAATRQARHRHRPRPVRRTGRNTRSAERHDRGPTVQQKYPNTPNSAKGLPAIEALGGSLDCRRSALPLGDSLADHDDHPPANPGAQAPAAAARAMNVTSSVGGPSHCLMTLAA